MYLDFSDNSRVGYYHIFTVIPQRISFDLIFVQMQLKYLLLYVFKPVKNLTTLNLRAFL